MRDVGMDALWHRDDRREHWRLDGVCHLVILPRRIPRVQPAVRQKLRLVRIVLAPVDRMVNPDPVSKRRVAPAERRIAMVGPLPLGEDMQRGGAQRVEGWHEAPQERTC